MRSWISVNSSKVLSSGSSSSSFWPQLPPGFSSLPSKSPGAETHQRSGPGYYLATFGRFFIPFHKAVAKKPGYALLRYVFHLCLFVVPIWLGGHIVLWSESRFGWDWKSLPDSWADWMTLLVLAAALFFLHPACGFPRAQDPVFRTGTTW